MLVGNSNRRIGGLALLVLALTLSAWVGAAQATPMKVVRYHGYVVKVPRVVEGLRPHQGPTDVRAL